VEPIEQMFSFAEHHDRQRLWLEIYDHECVRTYRFAPKHDSDPFTALSQEEFLGCGVAVLVIMDSQQGSATRAVGIGTSQNKQSKIQNVKEFSIIQDCLSPPEQGSPLAVSGSAMTE
jgi:hypothetical protein